MTYQGEDSLPFQRFLLKKCLGRGQYGVVWAASDPNLGPDCRFAIKIAHHHTADGSEWERFRKEAQLAGKVNHPGIVAVYDVGEWENRAYIVSELVGGYSLEEWLLKQRPSPQAAAEIAEQIADALQHAHERGVIHRDLKPGNVLMTTDGKPKLTDFGLAINSFEDATLSLDGSFRGTPAYMSPEQALGHSNQADARSDVFSLGVILYEMLTGKRPFQSKGYDLLKEISETDPPPPRSLDPLIPRDLETICLKALSKSPNDRYQTARQMSVDLQLFRNHQRIRGKRGKLWTRLTRIRRSQLLVCISSMAAIVLAIFSILSNQDDLPDDSVVSYKNSELMAGDIKGPRTVLVKTSPQGARVVFHPLHPVTGQPLPHLAIRPEAVTPLHIELTPGDYLVVAYTSRSEFHEVYRRVPDLSGALQYNERHRLPIVRAGNIVELHPIKLFPQSQFQDYVKLTGTESESARPFRMPSASLEFQVPPFMIARREATVGEYRSTPIYGKGRMPLTWPYGKDPPANDVPLTEITWDGAVEFAECAGARLLTSVEFAFCLSKQRELLQQSTQSEVPLLKVEALDSGIIEWTSSSALFVYPDRPSNPLYLDLIDLASRRQYMGNMALLEDLRADHSHNPSYFAPHLGVRLGRSDRPRLNPEDFERLATTDSVHPIATHDPSKVAAQ